MKRIFLSMVCMLMCLAGYSQDITGKWITEAGDAQVEIYESNGKLTCNIMWLEKGP